jgi:hypothetical protein
VCLPGSRRVRIGGCAIPSESRIIFDCTDATEGGASELGIIRPRSVSTFRGTLRYSRWVVVNVYIIRSIS